jgi:2-dehydropantoate 2-reductase
MIPNPRIIVVGPGAMGCLHGGLLAGAGFRVALLDHRPERAQLIARRGIRLTMPDSEELSFSLHCTSDPPTITPANLLILFTKAHDTAKALRSAELVRWRNPVGLC